MKQVEIEKLDLNGERVKTKNEIPTEIADLTDGQQTLNAITQNTQDIDNIENTLPNLASQNYVDQKFNGAAKAISFDSYATMITAFNALADDVYVSGQNINILTLEVPDLWVYEVDSTRIPYTYVDDATFVNELSTNGYVQVGFYKLAALETQKVDLTDYQEKLTTTNIQSGTITEGIGFDNLGNVVRGSAGGGNYISLDTTTQTLEGNKNIEMLSTKELTIGNNNINISILTKPAAQFAIKRGSSMLWISLPNSTTDKPYFTINNTYQQYFPLKSGTFALTSDINTKVPDAPTTDGTYTLKVVVTNGTPTYQWVLDT